MTNGIIFHTLITCSFITSHRFYSWEHTLFIFIDLKTLTITAFVTPTIFFGNNCSLMGILVFCNTKLNSAVMSLASCCSVKSNGKQNSRSCEYPFSTNAKDLLGVGEPQVTNISSCTLQNIYAVKSQHVLVTKSPHKCLGTTADIHNLFFAENRQVFQIQFI